jgi:hypothetical protein
MIATPGATCQLGRLVITGLLKRIPADLVVALPIAASLQGNQRCSVNKA